MSGRLAGSRRATGRSSRRLFHLGRCVLHFLHVADLGDSHARNPGGKLGRRFGNELYKIAFPIYRPLYSVFKLPLAVAVLKNVEERQLVLEKKVRVTPDDVAPGSEFNTDLWRKPGEKTVAELLEFSIMRSDNTSSDKLLEQVGGPGAVTRRMRELGFKNIDIQYTTREFAAHRDKPNTGTASDLAHLLAQLQKGEILQQPQLTLLLGFMTRAMTGGERRLRADLPAGTPVADKTGTGEPGSSTNDVGLITLPEGKGHLAVAVLLSGSKLPVADQEKLIAQLARAAYDSYVLSGSR